MKFSSTQSFKTFFFRNFYFIPEFHSLNPLRKLERIKVLLQPEFHLFQLLMELERFDLKRFFAYGQEG